jgi:RNA polymerase sigma factor (sigma-70 family)
MTARKARQPLPPFQHLLDRYADDVLRFLISQVGMPDADDCFQETFIAALRSYPTLRDAQNLRGWLLTIARRKAVDSRRAASRRPLLVDPVPDVRDGTERRDIDDEGVWDSVRALPPKQRQAVLLRYAADHTFKDIAQSLSITEEAARQNVHEGLTKLRKERIRP